MKGIERVQSGPEQPTHERLTLKEKRAAFAEQGMAGLTDALRESRKVTEHIINNLKRTFRILFNKKPKHSFYILKGRGSVMFFLNYLFCNFFAIYFYRYLTPLGSDVYLTIIIGSIQNHLSKKNNFIFRSIIYLKRDCLMSIH
mgnify:CR=1 FL=1